MRTTVLSRDGWPWLILSTLSRAYLVFMLSLVAIAALPGFFGWHGTVVQSGSMEPRISAGDIVMLAPVDQRDPLNVGAVVQYRSPAAAEPDNAEKLRLHRIVTANDDGTFVTAGDANRNADSTPLAKEQVTGQARLLVPLVGLPGFWATTGQLGPLAIWLVATLIALFAAVSAPGGRKAEAPSDSTGGQLPPHESDGDGAEARPEPAAVSRRTAQLLSLGVLSVALVVLSVSPAAAAFTARTAMPGNSWTAAVLPPLDPFRAAPYALLAATSVVNEGPRGKTSVTGSIGTFPGTDISGFVSVSGSTDAGNEVAGNAIADAALLHDAAGSRPVKDTLDPVLAGRVAPGVYGSANGTFAITDEVILDAQGDPSAVFIFNADVLTAEPGSTVTLVNGASAHNVFWRITETITLSSASLSKGNYLANGAAVMHDDATLEGRLVSLTSSITVSRATVATPA